MRRRLAQPRDPPPVSVRDLSQNNAAIFHIRTNHNRELARLSRGAKKTINPAFSESVAPSAFSTTHEAEVSSKAPMGLPGSEIQDVNGRVGRRTRREFSTDRPKTNQPIASTALVPVRRQKPCVISNDSTDSNRVRFHVTEQKSWQRPAKILTTLGSGQRLKKPEPLVRFTRNTFHTPTIREIGSQEDLCQLSSIDVKTGSIQRPPGGFGNLWNEQHWESGELTKKPMKERHSAAQQDNGDTPSHVGTSKNRFTREVDGVGNRQLGQVYDYVSAETQGNTRSTYGRSPSRHHRRTEGGRRRKPNESNSAFNSTRAPGNIVFSPSGWTAPVQEEDSASSSASDPKSDVSVQKKYGTSVSNPNGSRSCAPRDGRGTETRPLCSSILKTPQRNASSYSGGQNGALAPSANNNNYPQILGPPFLNQPTMTPCHARKPCESCVYAFCATCRLPVCMTCQSLACKSCGAPVCLACNSAACAVYSSTVCISCCGLPIHSVQPAQPPLAYTNPYLSVPPAWQQQQQTNPLLLSPGQCPPQYVRPIFPSSPYIDWTARCNISGVSPSYVDDTAGNQPQTLLPLPPSPPPQSFPTATPQVGMRVPQRPNKFLELFSNAAHKDLPEDCPSCRRLQAYGAANQHLLCPTSLLRCAVHRHGFHDNNNISDDDDDDGEEEVGAIQMFFNILFVVVPVLVFYVLAFIGLSRLIAVNKFSRLAAVFANATLLYILTLEPDDLILYPTDKPAIVEAPPAPCPLPCPPPCPPPCPRPCTSPCQPACRPRLHCYRTRPCTPLYSPPVCPSSWPPVSYCPAASESSVSASECLDDPRTHHIYSAPI